MGEAPNWSRTVSMILIQSSPSAQVSRSVMILSTSSGVRRGKTLGLEVL